MAIDNPVTKTTILSTWGQDVAAAINALEGSVPWITATLLNGWTHNPSSPVQYRKIGLNVEVRGRGQHTSSAPYVPIFNFPTGFRPVVDHVSAIAVVVGGGWSVGVVSLAPDGNLNPQGAPWQAASTILGFSLLA